jgi:hypothetical protein
MKQICLIAYLAAVFFAVPCVFAQAAPVAPPQDKLPVAASQKIPIPLSPAKDALWAALHKKDSADKALTDLQTQAQQLFAKFQAQQTEAQKQVEAAESAVLQELKLDPAKYVINPETMEAAAKGPEATRLTVPNIPPAKP